MHILVDECVSPEVAVTLREERGVDAIHLRDRRMTGGFDPVVLEFCLEQTRTLVTENAEDFRNLARSKEVHPGIIIIAAGVGTPRQISLTLRAMDCISEASEAAGEVDPSIYMTNKVAEVDRNGVVEIYNLPPSPDG